MPQVSEDRITFIPGEHWTAERMVLAAAAHREMRESPGMVALMDAIAQASDAQHDPAAMAASLAGVEVDRSSAGPVDLGACVFRRGHVADVPRLQQLIVSGNLPPFFIEPFVEGFLVIEHQQELVGCGGNEHYGATAVIRSVVVHERARGLGLGLQIAQLLIEDARASGATDLYLFTMEAYEFWKRLGFVDLELSKWHEATREQWQYAFIEAHPQAAAEVRKMWRLASR